MAVFRLNEIKEYKHKTASKSRLTSEDAVVADGTRTDPLTGLIDLTLTARHLFFAIHTFFITI